MKTAKSFKKSSTKESKEKASWVRRHKVLTVLLVIVFLIIVSSMSSDKKKASTDTANPTAATSATTSTNTKSAAKIAKIGETARDGKFEFVVKSIDCGHATVGTNEYLTQTAHGQYCLVTLSIKNIGDKSQTMFGDNQKLLNAAGQQYSYDSTATIYADTNSSSTWYSDINPGVTVEGTIVFDIPVGQTPVTAVLHDSSMSNGVKVSLQ